MKLDHSKWRKNLNYPPLSALEVRLFPLLALTVPSLSILETNPRIGKVTDGLILHPDNEHILFPLGTTIVVRNIITRTQQFLRGHDNDVSVIRVSNSGKYIATG